MQVFRKYFIVLLIGLVALFVQGALLKSAAPETIVVPNLLLIVTVFLAFYEVSIAGVALAFVLGLEIDLGTGLLLGPWAAAFVAAFGLVSSISQRVFVESPIAVALAVFGSSLLATFIYLAFLFQFRPVAVDLFSFLFVMLIEALFTAALAPLLFPWLKRLLLPRPASGGRVRGL